MTLASLLDSWKRDEATAPNISAWQTIPPRPAQTHPFPTGLPAPLSQALLASGIHSLYSHQFETWTATQQNQNIILSTGTASGKTLAYNLPVFTELIANPNSRALYLFPTKALAQDQLSALANLKLETWNLTPAIYDGDTPQKDRPQIRDRSHDPHQPRYASHRHPAASHQLGRPFHPPQICDHR
ncbi:MAG TPA: DEAD/DEAH box helicase [Anaerolineales bacterium]|nr:DEAD/DEAH box helicase [Anaerolineales bacterium]